MSYRSDLDAAHARAEAAERRARELEQRLVAQAKRSEIVPRPARMLVETLDDGVRIVWPWVRWSSLGHVITALAAIAIAVVVVVTESTDTAAIVLFGLVAIAATYIAVAHVRNQAMLTATHERLQVEHGPLPMKRTRTVSTADVVQLYVASLRKRETQPVWSVFAYLVDGTEQELVDALHREEAIFLERTIERALGIADRPVAGSER